MPLFTDAPFTYARSIQQLDSKSSIEIGALTKPNQLFNIAEISGISAFLDPRFFYSIRLSLSFSPENFSKNIIR